MPRFKEQPKEQEKYKPSSRDTASLSDKLKKYPSKVKIGLYDYYPIHQVMLADKIIRSNPLHGEIEVSSPQLYKQYMDTFDLLTWQQEKDAESLYRAFPEERVEHEKRIDALKEAIHRVLGRTKEIGLTM